MSKKARSSTHSNAMPQQKEVFITQNQNPQRMRDDSAIRCE